MKKYHITYTREFTFDTPALSLEQAAQAASRMALAGANQGIKILSIYEDGKQPGARVAPKMLIDSEVVT